MTDPRWEALRKAAQVVLDNGYAPCECAGDVTCLVCDMRAALAALEEPAPSEEGSRPEVSRGHASWCDLRTPKETLGVLRCTCGWEEARPASSKALDREALADAYGIACVNYAPLEGRIGPRDHPKFVRAKDARAALLAAWEAEVAALRAEVEKERKTAGLEYQSGSIWRQRALAAEAALATERARALEEAGGFEGHPPGVCLEHGRFRLEGAGLIDTEGPLSLCTGCGQLPPHAGCQAICAACAPPNGTCYCAGCQVAGKASPPPAPAPQGEERCKIHDDKWIEGTPCPKPECGGRTDGEGTT